MRRFWDALFCAHLLGLMGLGGCYFFNAFALSPEVGLPAIVTILVSLGSFLTGFVTSYFLFPKTRKS